MSIIPLVYDIRSFYAGCLLFCTFLPTVFNCRHTVRRPFLFFRGFLNWFLKISSIWTSSRTVYIFHWKQIWNKYYHTKPSGFEYQQQQKPLHSKKFCFLLNYWFTRRKMYVFSTTGLCSITEQLPKRFW